MPKSTYKRGHFGKAVQPKQVAETAEATILIEKMSRFNQEWEASKTWEIILADEIVERLNTVFTPSVAEGKRGAPCLSQLTNAAISAQPCADPTN